MATLLLRLSGPMQAWGTQSRFRDRDTGLEPSKSGVVGLLCAALGRPRHAAVDDLATLRMAVRVDHPGLQAVDYQTVGANYPRYDTRGQESGRTQAIALSSRFYLADACFLVGLEGDEGPLHRIDAALGAPRWQLFLGRKAFPPGEPVRLANGLRKDPLEVELAHHPLLDDRARWPIRVVIDDPEGPEARMDVPVSFAERRFSGRRVRTYWVGGET